jgi:multiple sugar transport system permease protein
MILPIIYIFSTAFKPMDELFIFPPQFLARKPTLDNFRSLFAQSNMNVPMVRYLVNSLAVTFTVLLMSVFLSSMAAYAMSKMQFKGKRFWFEVNQLALMFVAASVAIPRYLVIERLGLINTLFAHILPIMAIPVGLFLVKQFVDQIPDSLIESARIDGAGEFRIYRSIIIPLIKPAVATMAILAFQTVWNNMETSQFYTTSENVRTLAFYMNTLSGGTTGTTVAGQGVTAAAALIMFVPNVIMFIFLQSKVMNTVAHSGIK